jgi:AraC-like DNA-binding protein
MNAILIKILSYQFLSIAVLMLLSKRSSQKGMRILALFLLFKGIALSSFHLGPFIRTYPILSLFFNTSFWIYPPLVWLYTFKLIHPNTGVITKKTLLIFSPAMAYFLYLSVKFILWQNKITPYITKAENTVFDICYYILMFYFLIRALTTLKTRKHQTNFANEYQWLRHFLIGFLVVWSAFALKNSANFFEIPKNTAHAILTFALVLLFICSNLIIWYALHTPSVFQLQDKIKKASGYKLSNTDYNNYTSTIKQFMESHKPHLNPELNLELFSREIGIHQRVISKVINSVFNQNFFGFINSYRITEAKKALENPANKQTILEILYNAGYNNKSVFNTSFKKETGLTPTQYRSKYKSHIPDNA